MFLVNSRLGLFTADQSLDHSFSRSYGVILPSSLTIVLSLTLGYSPCPPVLVLGTGTYIINHRNFSWKHRVRRFHWCRHQLHHHASPCQYTDLPIYKALHLDQNPITGSSYLSPSFHLLYRWYRNINLLYIDYAFRPRLSPWLTLGGRTFPRKP